MTMSPHIPVQYRRRMYTGTRLRDGGEDSGNSSNGHGHGGDHGDEYGVNLSLISP